MQESKGPNERVNERMKKTEREKEERGGGNE